MTVEFITTRIYDNFGGTGLDPSKWSILEVPSGESTTWKYQDPNARVSVSNGVLEIRVEQFSLQGVGVQMFDNPKHLLWSKEQFPIPSNGVARFSCEMAAENVGGNPFDYRQGSAGFVNGDFQTLMIFDVLTTSQRIHPLYERLFIPGMSTMDEAFTYAVDAPLAGLGQTRPGQWHEYTVELDAGRGSARWYVDGKKAFEVAKVAYMPKTLQIGLGVFTLIDFEDGRSVSCQGQGIIGRWRNVRYSAS